MLKKYFKKAERKFLVNDEFTFKRMLFDSIRNINLNIYRYDIRYIENCDPFLLIYLTGS